MRCIPDDTNEQAMNDLENKKERTDLEIAKATDALKNLENKKATTDLSVKELPKPMHSSSRHRST